ncbi:MAG TPA: type II secretion system protein [Gemmata sp.]
MTKRRAFTLVELLTAVAVITILIGMAALAYRYVTRNAREDRGRVAMETAKAVLTAYNGAGGSMRHFTSPTEGMYYVTGNKPPAYLALPPKTPTTDMSPDGAARHGAAALRNARAMRILAKAGGMQKMLYELPAELRAYLEYHPGLTYRHGDELQVGGTFYRFTAPPGQPDATTTAAPPSANWVETSIDKVTPMLADGEGNLLLFVPGDGLIVTLAGYPNQRVITTYGAPVPMSGSTPMWDAAFKGSTPPTGAAAEALTGKPYFVAPGTDADYTTGDDNAYSFR